MQVTLAHVGARTGAKGGRARAKDNYEALIGGYLQRCAGVIRCGVEVFRNESTLLEWLGKQRGRTEAVVLLLDARGPQMTSESLAEWLAKRRDEGRQHVVFAVGPADGWSAEALAEGKRRGGLLSLGSMTLAHHLARLVVAEQLYRACTILTGHPYHTGH
jgi:23S rRNA (pseudouridine1915-N3)-methyltransferase